MATVCREVFNAIGGGESLLGSAVWSPKLRVGRNSGSGLPRLDSCGLSKLDWIGWKIGGGGGQRQAGNGGREKGWQDGRGALVVPPGISANGRNLSGNF